MQLKLSFGKYFISQSQTFPYTQSGNKVFLKSPWYNRKLFVLIIDSFYMYMYNLSHLYLYLCTICVPLTGIIFSVFLIDKTYVISEYFDDFDRFQDYIDHILIT